jgi:MoaA/NifB/PqqE/SkfB family radical SAM enzyme
MDELPETFCFLPFSHISIDTDGKAKLCCSTHEHICSETRPMSLHIDTFAEIWNSGYMQDVRHKMLRGQPVAPCFRCYYKESLGDVSLRMYENRKAFRFTGLSSPGEIYRYAFEMVDDHSGYVPAPLSLNLWLGNRCNLKCRMCNGRLSSKIAADKLHAGWSHTEYHWNRVATLLPVLAPGVRYTGFSDLLNTNEKAYRRIQAEAGAAMFLPGNGDPLTEIYVSGLLEIEGKRELAILIDEKPIFTDSITTAYWQRRVPLPYNLGRDGAKIRITTDTAGEGLGITDLVVGTSGPRPTTDGEQFVTRLPETSSWAENRDLLISEIFAAPEKLREINLAGGEPLLIPHTVPMLEKLVDDGHSQNIEIFISTNGTIFSRRIVSLLKEFRSSCLGFSIDAVGPLLEYIRHPSKWETIKKNLLDYQEMGIYVAVLPTLQAYNVFGLVEIARFCNSHEIEFHFSNVLFYPRFLSFDMLPNSVIAQAVQEWEHYRDHECKENHRNEVEVLLSALRRPRPENRLELQEKFIEFTIELDRDRGQTLELAEPRLYAHFPFSANGAVVASRSIA